MVTSDLKTTFHRNYGLRSRRAVYYRKDFLDYCLMIAVSAGVVRISYGAGIMSAAGLILCLLMLVMFVVRHGVEFRVPAVLRRPEELLYMFLYKIQNLKPMFAAAVVLLVLENLIIGRTPGLPHHTSQMRIAALWLFYGHFVGITLYRTVILYAHCGKRELIREVLMQTPWQRVIKPASNIMVEIVHAYCTGLITHIIMIAPWFLLITNLKSSLVLLPLVCILDAAIHVRWMIGYNRWYYRDHWLGHNAELDFLYLHGTHHDAIPSGLIAVSENGLLEGFLRFSFGWPTPFYSPVICFLISTYDVKNDIDMHQYIPGIFPRLPKVVMQGFQHSTHHYGPIEPYSVGAKVDQPNFPEELRKKLSWVPEGIKNSAKLDEELDGFEWDNPTYRKILSLFDKYQS
jgi:hypothetical protein